MEKSRLPEPSGAVLMTLGLSGLMLLRRLGKTDFTTTDAYAFTRELEKLHPDISRAEG